MKPYAARLARFAGLLALLSALLAYYVLYPLPTLASENLGQPVDVNPPAQLLPDTRLATTRFAPLSKDEYGASASLITQNPLVPPKDTSCSTIWASYPQGGYVIPDWLYTPLQSTDLATDEPYLYLAGRLLQEGLASAPNCPYNGMLPNGFASPCGLEAARTQVTAWQNRFDAAIFKSSVENAIPANLLKRIFAQESQFWLGLTADNQHVGIGQITEGGIDPLFLSYPDFYKLVCSDVLSADTCKSKYSELSNQNKALIRGYFLRTVIDASCPDCAEKYDPQKAKATIDIFAKLIVANCEQVGRVISDITEQKPGTMSTYDDLWRYTLVNYNGGSGCVSGAIEATAKADEPLDWLHVSARLQSHCKGAKAYVENVSR